MNDRIDTQAASELAKRGKLTGPVSRFFSFIQIFALLFLLLHLGVAGQYISLLSILILGFTSFGIFALLGNGIYFVILRDWNTLLLISICGVSGLLSAYFGMRNIKATLNEDLSLSDRPIPFEQALFQLQYRLDKVLSEDELEAAEPTENTEANAVQKQLFDEQSP